MKTSIFSKTASFVFSLQFVACSFFSFGQNTRSVADITAIVSKTDNLKSVAQYEFSPNNVSYKFIYDTLQNKLLKVVVTSIKDSQPKEYYFSDNELVFIKSSWGKSYFSDIDFSVGSTWKNENDSMLISRERDLAAAYRFLVFHKKKEAGIYTFASTSIR
ncbi:MAG: hypothetical protein WAR78_14290 [Ferruginibacter sp.]